MNRDDLLILLSSLVLVELTLIVAVGYHIYTAKVTPILTQFEDEYTKINTFLGKI